MNLSDIIPKGEPQRAYCAKCKRPMDLVFRPFADAVSGIEISIEGLPILWCHACDLTALPDRTRASIMFAHEAAAKAGQTRFTSRRRKIEQNFGFTRVPFAYDPDDYFYYPGLARPLDVGFLTPVFFDKRVLVKYDIAPDYAVRFASPTYGEIAAEGFSIPFGINRHGAVIMWLGDVARLPLPEQHYLMSENRPSDHCIGSEFYEAQIECVFTPPPPESRLFQARSAFHDACFQRFGTKIAHLEVAVLDLATSLVRPVLDTRREHQIMADTLNKIHVESLDNGALERLLRTLGVEAQGTGSLKRLQALLETLDGTAGQLLSPFYVLYDLRIAYSHLRSDEGRAAMLKSAIDRLSLPDSADITALYDALVKDLTRSYEALCVVLRSSAARAVSAAPST